MTQQGAMTQQEALVAAIQDAKERPPRWGDDLRLYAAAILDALPEGWGVYPSDDYRTSVEIIADNAAKAERDRLREAWTTWAGQHGFIGERVDRYMLLALLADPEDDR